LLTFFLKSRLFCCTGCCFCSGAWGLNNILPHPFFRDAKRSTRIARCRTSAVAESADGHGARCQFLLRYTLAS
jgi:hypothetical protein